MSDDSDTQQALRDLSRAVGGLESTVRDLRQTWQSQEQSATNGRRILHEKFDDLRTDVLKLGAQVEGALRDIATIKPSVKTFDNATEQAKGVQTFFRWMWGGLAFVGGSAILAFTSWFTITPKH